MKIAERTAAWRRERRVLLRVSRAAWRLDQAGRERSWALASARAEGVPIRTLAAAGGLSSSRVHQIVAAAGLDELAAALGELRAAGCPAPEDPDGDDDAELDGHGLIADRVRGGHRPHRRRRGRARPGPPGPGPGHRRGTPSIPSDVVCAAAEIDPTIWPAVPPYLTLQALPSVLDPVRDKARAVLRTGWRPPYAAGPSRSELADAIPQPRDRSAA